jgi:CheY-like chemotaxis protein
VVAVDSGEAALSALDADPGFSLLLTDVVMPGLDGFQLAERARAAVPGLEVLFMSGYHEARPGQAAPGEVVQKPFTPEELVGSVREKLARAGGEPARTV